MADDIIWEDICVFIKYFPTKYVPGSTTIRDALRTYSWLQPRKIEFGKRKKKKTYWEDSG